MFRAWVDNLTIMPCGKRKHLVNYCTVIALMVCSGTLCTIAPWKPLPNGSPRNFVMYEIVRRRCFGILPAPYQWRFEYQSGKYVAARPPTDSKKGAVQKNLDFSTDPPLYQDIQCRSSKWFMPLRDGLTGCLPLRCCAFITNEMLWMKSTCTVASL